MAPHTSHIARLKDLLAFVAELALQFWPPYRFEHDETPASQLASVKHCESKRLPPRR